MKTYGMGKNAKSLRLVVRDRGRLKDSKSIASNLADSSKFEMRGQKKTLNKTYKKMDFDYCVIWKLLYNKNIVLFKEGLERRTGDKDVLVLFFMVGRNHREKEIGKIGHEVGADDGHGGDLEHAVQRKGYGSRGRGDQSKYLQ